MPGVYPQSQKQWGSNGILTPTPYNKMKFKKIRKKIKKKFFEIFLLISCIYQNLFVYLHPYLVIIVRMIITLSQIDKRSYIILVKLAHQSDCEKVEDKVPLG